MHDAIILRLAQKFSKNFRVETFIAGSDADASQLGNLNFKHCTSLLDPPLQLPESYGVVVNPLEIMAHWIRLHMLRTHRRV